jgi:hypothetical protein
MNKGQIKVVCYFDDSGEDVWDLINESFILFIQSELSKESNQCS